MVFAFYGRKCDKIAKIKMIESVEKNVWLHKSKDKRRFFKSG